MDLRRHMELFNPEEFKTPVTIIGAGATGSFVAYQLAKMGIEDITVYDFDKVEPHNVPNQLFGLKDVGMQKVVALAGKIFDDTGIAINIHDEKFTTQRLAGVVIMQVDSMSERSRIFNQHIFMKPQVKHVIDSRMGLDMGRIYNINPVDMKESKRYQDSLYGDEESEVSACGASMTVITSAMNIASIVARQVINWHNEVDLNNEIMVDYLYNQIITNNC